MRNRNKGAEVAAVAEHSGFPQEDIALIYDHIFVNEHDLDAGHVRFDPLYGISQSWQRLREGKNIQPHDITLLNHERLEERMMRAGMSYIKAHRIAQRRYNYAKELEDFEGGV